jgi:hypothetical protein
LTFPIPSTSPLHDVRFVSNDVREYTITEQDKQLIAAALDKHGTHIPSNFVRTAPIYGQHAQHTVAVNPQVTALLTLIGVTDEAAVQPPSATPLVPAPNPEEIQLDL